MISRDAGLWILLYLAWVFSKSHFLRVLFAFVQYFVELRKCRFLFWITSLYSTLNHQKCELVWPVWIWCWILNNMFSTQIIYICAATARMRTFFDIKLFYLQIILIWWKMIISIFIIQILHFLINIAGYIHICAVKRFTAQKEISNQQIIFIINM